MKKMKKKKNAFFFIISRLALITSAIIAIPKVIDYLSSKMYSHSISDVKDDDDWGPEIVKREKSTDNAIKKEENTDGKL